MLRVREKLLAAGYRESEIWAPSYLGQEIAFAEMPVPQRSNIDDVRRFVDAVSEYLDVDRIDLVGHSLGCGMINGYLRGLQSDGSFDANHQRFARAGAVVCLSGALYGTGDGPLYEPEFSTSGAFVAASLDWKGVEDATPYGARSVEEMIAPTSGVIPGGRTFRAVTEVDSGRQRIHYVSLWAVDDIVDAGLKNASGLQGADLNQAFDVADTMPGVLTAGLARHMHMLHDQSVFDTFLPFLNR
jgi:pimeloyl-ACP methyl ester carboxylesterase